MNSRHVSLLSFALGGLLIAACGGGPKSNRAASPTSESTAPAASPEEVPAQDPVDENSWEAFFPKFQAAAASGSAIDVSLLASFEELDKDDFIDQFDIFFSAEMKKVIADSTAASWPESKEEPGVRQIVWSDSTVNEDGEEFESALFLYFKQVDGKWRLFRWMAAG